MLAPPPVPSGQVWRAATAASGKRHAGAGSGLSALLLIQPLQESLGVWIVGSKKLSLTASLALLCHRHNKPFTLRIYPTRV